MGDATEGGNRNRYPSLVYKETFPHVPGTLIATKWMQVYESHHLILPSANGKYAFVNQPMLITPLENNTRKDYAGLRILSVRLLI